jgi:hypothetical protein
MPNSVYLYIRKCVSLVEYILKEVQNFIIELMHMTRYQNETYDEYWALLNIA